MKESICIQNFGPLKDINIEDIKPFTVLIGESGSGKSTLMKVLALFRWLYKMQNIRAYLKHSNISKSPFRFRMETYLKNCGFSQLDLREARISYSVETKSGGKHTITCSKGKWGVPDMRLPQGDISFNKIAYISETRNLIPIWAEKGAASKEDLGFYFNEVFSDFDLAANEITELLFPYLKVKFRIQKTQSGKKYMVLPTEGKPFEIRLKDASSGMQNAIPTTLIIEYFSKYFDFKKAFDRSVLGYLSESDRLTDFRPAANLSDLHKKIYIHIEEPELSLYPDAQRQLIASLVDKCFASGRAGHEMELILATHSPYVINYLNLLIKAFDKNEKVDGAGYDFDKLAVYLIEDGKNEDLKSLNRLVDTNPLSETINAIYNEYANLGNGQSVKQ